ncbi:MAG: Holliday junction branch migration protein RuvA, partial [Candidatus Binataceae bacterium]
LMLYGFAASAEKRAFDFLMQVQHVGPKLALAVLSVLSPEELVTAINREDVARIDAVPGVGPKVAERVVRELRDKMADLQIVVSDGATGAVDGAGNGAAPPGAPADDAISALINLGYRPLEARRAVDAVVRTDQGAALDMIIRESLTHLMGDK